jgi:branched-chain amino acid transport system substrate-binding protein
MFMTRLRRMNDQSYAIADYAFDNAGAPPGLCLDGQLDGLYPSASRPSFVERFVERGGEIIDEDFFMMGDTDFSPRSQGSPPSIPPPTPSSSRPSRARPASRPPDQGGRHHHADHLGRRLRHTELVRTAPAPSSPTTSLLDPHLPRRRPPEVQEFIDAYTEHFGHPPENSFAPLGYDAIGLIAAAIETADRPSPPPSATASPPPATTRP